MAQEWTTGQLVWQHQADEDEVCFKMAFVGLAFRRLFLYIPRASKAITQLEKPQASSLDRRDRHRVKTEGLWIGMKVHVTCRATIPQRHCAKAP